MSGKNSRRSASPAEAPSPREKAVAQPRESCCWNSLLEAAIIGTERQKLFGSRDWFPFLDSVDFGKLGR